MCGTRFIIKYILPWFKSNGIAIAIEISVVIKGMVDVVKTSLVQ